MTANGSGRCSRQCAASTHVELVVGERIREAREVVDHVGAVLGEEVDVDVAVLRERAGAEVELLHAATASRVGTAGRVRAAAKASCQSWNMSSVQSCLRWSRAPARCSCTSRSTSRGVEEALRREPRRREQVEQRLAQARLQPRGDGDAEALLLARRDAGRAAASRERALEQHLACRAAQLEVRRHAARNSTSVWSRNGARTSSEASMLARSVFTRMSSGEIGLRVEVDQPCRAARARDAVVVQRRGRRRTGRRRVGAREQRRAARRA